MPRARLLTSLRGCAAPLVVFSAPTGSGKTLTVRQWLDAERRAFAWLQLDRGDNDPVSLLQYVARALTPVTPLDPVVTTWLELPEPPIERVILPTLAAAVSSAPPFVLVLDDSHFVREPRCWAVLAALVEALPPGSTIVVSGREDPALPLARMRAQEAVAEYGFGELAFDREEARRLLETHDVSADDQALDALVEATEGWPAAIYLAALASGHGGVPLPDLALSGGRREIADYLTSEVLDGLDADTVQFLTWTSITWRLCGDLADALTGREDGAVMLDAIDRANLFVMHVDGLTGWYRYHHLFSDLLQAELLRREPGAVRRLHRRAARWFAAHDLVLDAVHHWLYAGDVRAAGDLVAARWTARYHTGRLLTVRQWIDAFTPDQLRSHVPLAVAASWVMAMTGDSRLARSLLEQVDGKESRDASPDQAASVASSIALLRSALAPSGVEHMRDDATLAVTLEEEGGGERWHGTALYMRGIAEMLCGCDADAESSLRRAAGENRAFRNGIELAALGHLSLLAGNAGRWGDAEEYAADAARVAASYELLNCLPSAPARMARDRLCARVGDADALADLEELVAEIDPDFLPWLRSLAMLLIAEGGIDRGAEAAARAWLDQARASVSRWAPAPGLDRFADALEMRLRRLSGIEPLTQAETRVLELLPTNLTVAQIARRLNVSPNTVGTHVKSIYRKLGVARRSAAVDRAAALGLVQVRPPSA